MADQYQVISDAPGFLSRLGDSFKGIVFGIIIFVLAFPLLWWGENRRNMAEFVDQAKLIVATSVPTDQGKGLVKTSGKLTTDETLNDPTYLASLGGVTAMQLERKVEMYAWKEDKKTEKKDNKEIDTYTYKQDWVSTPQDSSKFHDQGEHGNPPLTEKEDSFKVQSAKVGAIIFDANKTEFYGLKDLTVTDAMLNKSAAKPLQLSGGAVYMANDSVDPTRKVVSNPKVGDVKITYSYFPANTDGSVVGDWDGQKIVSHVYDKTDMFLGAYAGTPDEFRAYLQTQHNMITWIIRVIAFLMMWGGLNGLLGPILTIMDSIPIVGGAGRAVISLVTGAIAFVLWVVTFVLAKFLWFILFIFGAGLVGFVMMAKKRHAAATTPVSV